jgi:hypothetical protein
MPQDRRYSSEDASVSPAALGSFRLSDFEDPNFDAKEYVDRTSRSVRASQSEEIMMIQLPWHHLQAVNVQPFLVNNHLCTHSGVVSRSTLWCPAYLYFSCHASLIP